ncbi:MAG: translation initiation factor IF-6 [Desulfurococcaceae archaeon]|nr:translation initiation factor IF-6 [Desulfurococcaceae archaeon]
MIIEKANYYGNPHIGLYIFTNDTVSFIPRDSEPKLEKLVESVLGVTVYRLSIADTNLINLFIVGNNKGILVPHIAKDYEIQIIKQAFDRNVLVVKSRYTALGNLCLVNDRAALVSPYVYNELAKYLKDILEVEVVEKGTIGEIPTVGSAAFVNNKGGLAHPDATDEDLRKLSQLFNVRFDVGTVNFGIGFIKSGLVGNSKGLLVGEKTTGPEIMRISKVFGDE